MTSESHYVPFWSLWLAYVVLGSHMLWRLGFVGIVLFPLLPFAAVCLAIREHVKRRDGTWVKN